MNAQQKLLSSVVLALTFLVMGCGSKSATPPATPPPPPAAAPSGQTPGQPKGGQIGPNGQNVPQQGQQLPGVIAGNNGGVGVGNGNEVCDDDWCYDYYTDNGLGQGVGGNGNGQGQGYNQTPGYNDNYYGDDGDSYSDYYGDGYDYGGNQWNNGWNGDGYYYYGDNFYLDSRSNALTRTRTTASKTSAYGSMTNTSKIKVRARSRR